MNSQPQSKILIVDDAVENIKLVTEILNRPKNEYHIEAAGDGYEALEKVKKFNPDLIMLDVVMPGIDGFEVCRILKEDERTRLIGQPSATCPGQRTARPMHRLAQAR